MSDVLMERSVMMEAINVCFMHLVNVEIILLVLALYIQKSPRKDLKTSVFLLKTIIWITMVFILKSLMIRQDISVFLILLKE